MSKQPNTNISGIIAFDASMVLILSTGLTNTRNIAKNATQ